MSVQDIKKVIAQLPPDEVASLTRWLSDYHAQLWDEQIADDLDEGNLNAVLEEVDKEYRAGLARPL
ncbi:MAG TPA: hypothetical protein VKX17_09920 [Planctomycetota bacterium]|nr:hypothetical protein [Planctomycetota bacterium]